MSTPQKEQKIVNRPMPYIGIIGMFGIPLMFGVKPEASLLIGSAHLLFRAFLAVTYSEFYMVSGIKLHESKQKLFKGLS